MTNSNGSARVSYSTVPVKSWSHRIEVFRDGYVPKDLSWSEHQQDRLEEIPESYTVKLDQAVTIGGVVVDEQSVPVEGARVVFSVSGPVASRARTFRTDRVQACAPSVPGGVVGAGLSGCTELRPCFQEFLKTSWH